MTRQNMIHNSFKVGERMEKVIIIGCPGSGKSTFGRKLHRVTGLPLYHLDMMYWNEDETIVPEDVFHRRLHNAMRNPRWIIEGNYESSMEIRMQACDTIFFLDYPTEVCLEGIEARVGQTRSDIPWVEKDTPDETLVSFVKSFRWESRPLIVSLLRKYSSKNVIVFKTRTESEEYLSLSGNIDIQFIQSS